MSRLIDADKIRYKDLNGDMPNSNIHVWITFLDWIKEMPTVEERKTGKWIFYDSDAERYDDIRCSVCGKHFTVDAERWCDVGFIASDLKYCPNCGAKMEGGKDE